MNCSRRLSKKGSAPTTSAPACSSAETREHAVDVAFGSRLYNAYLHIFYPRGHLSVFYRGLRGWTVRVYQDGDYLEVRNQLGQIFDPLTCHCSKQDACARRIAARPSEAGDQPVGNGVASDLKNDRDRGGCVFRRASERGPKGRNQIDLSGDKIGGQCRRSIIVALCVAILDRYVFSFDITFFAQSLEKLGGIGRVLRCRKVKEADRPASPPVARARQAAGRPPRRQ